MEQRWKGNDGNIHAFLDINSTKPDFLGLMYKRITTIVPNFYLDEFTTTFFFTFFTGIHYASCNYCNYYVRQ